MSKEDSGATTRLAPFNPSSDLAISTAIEMGGIVEGDVLYDLGCGDGRVIIQAALQKNVKCIGVEYNEELSNRAKKAVELSGVNNLVTIIHGDAFTYIEECKSASVIFVYLTPKGMVMIAQMLSDAIARGARVLSFTFKLPGFEYKRMEVVKGLKMYLYDNR